MLLQGRSWPYPSCGDGGQGGARHQRYILGGRDGCRSPQRNVSVSLVFSQFFFLYNDLED